MVTVKPPPLYLFNKAPVTSQTGGLGGPRISFGLFGEEIILLSLLKIETIHSNPWSIHYTY